MIPSAAWCSRREFDGRLETVAAGTGPGRAGARPGHALGVAGGGVDDFDVRYPFLYGLVLSFHPKEEGPHWWSYLPERIKTDREGRFRIEALLPGYEFHLSDDKGELPFGGALRSGQTKDLGDVQMKKAEN